MHRWGVLGFGQSATALGRSQGLHVPSLQPVSGLPSETHLPQCFSQTAPLSCAHADPSYCGPVGVAGVTTVAADGCGGASDGVPAGSALAARGGPPWVSRASTLRAPGIFETATAAPPATATPR